MWADEAARLPRLDAAFGHAAARPVRVEKADAGPWLVAALGARPAGAATVLYHSIFWKYVAAGTRDRLRAAIEAAGLEVEYLAVVDPETLDDVALIAGPVRLLVAARLGATRLIDNMGARPAAPSRAMEDAT